MFLPLPTWHQPAQLHHPPTSTRYAFWEHSHTTVYATRLETFRAKIRLANHYHPFKLRFLVTDLKDRSYGDPPSAYPPLEYAILKGDEESLRYLLSLPRSSKYVSDSLAFFYIDCLEKHCAPNLEILKLLLGRMTDINITLAAVYEGDPIRLLDYAIWHMGSLCGMHMEVIEELFRRGARSSCVGAYSAFALLKSRQLYAFGSPLLRVVECVTAAEKWEITRKELKLRLTYRAPSHGRHRHYHWRVTPQSYTSFDTWTGKLRLRTTAMSPMCSVRTKHISGIYDDSPLPDLHRYLRLEKAYVPDSTTCLTVEEFGSQLSGLRSLFHSVQKIYPLCQDKSLATKHIVSWKERLERPLSLWLVKEQDASFEPFEMRFRTYFSAIDQWKKEKTVFICNEDTGYPLALGRALFLLHKSMLKHQKYFQTLVKEGRFEDCFKRKEIQDLTHVLKAIIEKFPVDRRQVYAEWSQEARHSHLAAL